MSRTTHFALCLSTVALGGLLMLDYVGAQPPGGKGSQGKDQNSTQEQSDPEARAILKTVERVVKGGGETEREKWLDEMRKVFRDQLSPGVTRDDFAQWYGLLAADGPAWRRDAAPKKAITELFDRVAARLELGEVETIRRDEFLTYSRRFLNPDNSPPWKDPLAEADKLFRDRDRDRSGLLESTEWTDGLRANARQIDANRDGRIDYNEYRRYFENRVMAAVQSLPQADPKRDNSISPFAPPGAPKVKSPTEQPNPGPIRAGNLPAGLPKWFVEFDLDRDGQVALHEWRKAGRSLAEFEEMDLNSDGLLTADEWLRYARDKARTAGEENPPIKK